jgi:hypothetical protein
LSGPQLAECGGGTLLVEIDHIHDEVVRLNDPDRQALLQVGRREVSYVERDNRGPCVAMAVTTTGRSVGLMGSRVSGSATSVSTSASGKTASVGRRCGPRVSASIDVGSFELRDCGSISRVCAVTTSDQRIREWPASIAIARQKAPYDRRQLPAGSVRNTEGHQPARAE